MLLEFTQTAPHVAVTPSNPVISPAGVDTGPDPAVPAAGGVVGVDVDGVRDDALPGCVVRDERGDGGL
jgi:hypothetical protein